MAGRRGGGKRKDGDIGEWVAPFLAAFASSYGNYSRAAVAAGIERRTIYNEMEKNPIFKKAVEDIKAGFVDDLRTSVIKRATRGVRTPVYQGGELVGRVRKFETALSIFALEKLDPDFAEKKTNDAPAEPQRLQIEIIASDPDRENKIRDALKKTE